MALECSVKSASVLAKLRVVSEDGAKWGRKRALIVLQDVESQASKNKISDGKIITDDEFTTCNFSKLLLCNSKELGEQSGLESLDGGRLFRILGEDKDLAKGIEHVAPSVDNHVDDASLLPVVVRVIAVLDAERSEDCEGLLLTLATASSDGQTAELSSVTSSLSLAPGILGSHHVLERNTLVFKELDGGVGTAIGILEVLNLDRSTSSSFESTSRGGGRTQLITRVTTSSHNFINSFYLF